MRSCRGRASPPGTWTGLSRKRAVPRSTWPPTGTGPIPPSATTAPSTTAAVCTRRRTGSASPTRTTSAAWCPAWRNKKTLPPDSPARRLRGAFFSAQPRAAKPCSRSAMISSMCSVPMDRRMVLGLIPWSSSSSGLSWEWVVVAGWMTRDFTSATFASREKISRRSINRWASAWPPLISKVKMDAPPWGKYFSYRAWSGWLGREGWFTFSTWGWLDRYSTTFLVFSAWRSKRRERVSTPWSSRKALKGEMAAPMSRRRIART